MKRLIKKAGKFEIMFDAKFGFNSDRANPNNYVSKDNLRKELTEFNINDEDTIDAYISRIENDFYKNFDSYAFRSEGFKTDYPEAGKYVQDIRRVITTHNGVCGFEIIGTDELDQTKFEEIKNDILSELSMYIAIDGINEPDGYVTYIQEEEIYVSYKLFKK